MNRKVGYAVFGTYLALLDFKRIKYRYLLKHDPKRATEYAYSVLKKLSNNMLKWSKTTLIINGKENIPKAPCLYIGNHQAIFDGFLMMATIDEVSGFISKSEMKKLPFVSKWLQSIRTVFINRDNPREAMRSLMVVAQNLIDGYSMTIFPEGTRSLSSNMGEFKRGYLKVAEKAKVPIVPLTLDGTYRILEVGDKLSGNTIKLTFHKPIYTENLTKEEINALDSTIYETIKNAL